MEDNEGENIMRIGVLGCGAIGSGVAKAVKTDFSSLAKLSGVYDIIPEKTRSLSSSLGDPDLEQKSSNDLLSKSDLIVETINSDETKSVIKSIIQARKDVLIMSVGKLLLAEDLFHDAEKAGTHILIPSGAVAGIDAIKAVSRSDITKIAITTYKPPRGLIGAPFLEKNRIDLNAITKETIIFDGTVEEAVVAFPQNINVAATIALASRSRDKLRIRIITSPELTYNRHEIHVAGDFGQITAVTENRPCPDNPKTSYLAVLSAIETLRSFCQKAKIGT